MGKDKSRSRRRSDIDKKILGHYRVIQEHKEKIKDALLTGEEKQWIPDWEKHVKKHEEEIRKLKALRDKL
jgi:hypothetical protein